MRSFTLATVVGLLMAFAGSAQGAPAVDGVFNLPEAPSQNPPALGPDGNVWVTLDSGAPDFARVAPDGTVTPFTSADVDFPKGITAGPDGNMWITLTNHVARFSPADPTTVTKFFTASIGTANHITVGPDGNLWTGSDTNVVKITPSAVPVITPIPTGLGTFVAKGIAGGSDGMIWVADGGDGGLLPVSTAGTVGTRLNLGGKVQQVAAGPGGQVAYTNPVNVPQTVGLVNGGVAAAPTVTDLKDPFGITLGQDGAYWIAQFGSHTIGRYTTAGAYSELSGLPALSGPRMLTRGSGNTLWVTLETSKQIARVSGVEPPNTDITPPTITKLKLTNSKFKVGTKKTALVAKKKKKKTPAGTTLSYTLSEIATTSIAVQKAAAGRRSGTACVKPTSKLKKAKAKKCPRYVVIKTLTRLQLAGANKVSFSGRIGKTKLKVGKYRFLITAQDANGNVSAPTKKSFTIVK